MPLFRGAASLLFLLFTLFQAGLTGDEIGFKLFFEIVRRVKLNLLGVMLYFATNNCPVTLTPEASDFLVDVPVEADETKGVEEVFAVFVRFGEGFAEFFGLAFQDSEENLTFLF